LFLDEQFNFKNNNDSGEEPVQSSGDYPLHEHLKDKGNPLLAKQSGYVYIYTSNESSLSVYFDDLKVRHDNGRILEETHYYAYGLKIAPLSSQAFGAIQNNYQYQGDYSEFDGDIGWNDFMLRNYDPELGRFMQQDPYDQFASGYVGMGNDPANGTDPTGGFFGVGGSGCAAAAGMSGYGGMAGRIAGSGNFMRVVSTVSTVASVAMNGAGLVSSIANGNGNRNQAFGSGAMGSVGNTSGNGGDDQNKSDGCNCPDGYGPNPKPGKNPRAFYKELDDAASAWALENRDPSYEASSLLFEVDVKNKDGFTVRLRSSSTPIRFKDKGKAIGESPDVFHPDHHTVGRLPKNAYVIGHIHLHPSYATKKNPFNTGFSIPDQNAFGNGSKFKKALDTHYLFVLGSGGELLKRNRNNLIERNGVYKTDLSNDINSIGKGYYSPNPPKPPPCPCYEQ